MLRSISAALGRCVGSVSLAIALSACSTAAAQQDWSQPVRLPPPPATTSLVTQQPATSLPIANDNIVILREPVETSSCAMATAPWGANERLFDNVSVFGGLDGSKQPQDFGVNAQFGGRASVNWGIPLFESAGVGAQIGTAIDATGDAVQVVERTLGSKGRTQSFTTVGLFQRLENGWSWGLAYDFLYENYYDTFNLGQWRFNVSYQLSPRNTIGVWSAIASQSDQGHFGVIPVTLTPITQTNAYFKHIWDYGVQTTFWCGLANSHGQVNAVLGDLQPVRTPFVFGSELLIPLTDRLAIFGQGNFMMPASSGVVDSYLGIAFYPRGGARTVAAQRYSPLQTVAAPTNFAVDLRR